jgi:hypothetical protein
MRLYITAFIYSIAQTVLRVFGGRGVEDVIDDKIQEQVKTQFNSWGMKPPD